MTEDHVWIWGEGVNTVECNDTDCNAKGVIVPAEGTWLVRDGKADEVRIERSDVTGYFNTFRKPKDDDDD